jgi:hypothetical protein
MAYTKAHGTQNLNYKGIQRQSLLIFVLRRNKEEALCNEEEADFILNE